MKSIKLTLNEIKLAKRALSDLENTLRKKAMEASREDKTGVATRHWNDVEMISKALQKLGVEIGDVTSAERISQIELEAAASDAHLAAFESLDAYNLPEQVGTHRELVKIKKYGMEDKILPCGIVGGWRAGETTGIGIGKIKVQPTEPPLLFCHAIEVGQDCEIIRRSEWFPYSQMDRANQVISGWMTHGE